MQATRISIGWISRCMAGEKILALMKADRQIVKDGSPGEGTLLAEHSETKGQTRIYSTSFVKRRSVSLCKVDRKTTKVEAKSYGSDSVIEFNLHVTANGEGMRGIIVADGSQSATKAAAAYLRSLGGDEADEGEESADDTEVISGLDIPTLDYDAVINWLGRASLEPRILSAKIAGYAPSVSACGPFSPRFNSHDEAVTFLSNLPEDVKIKSFVLAMKCPDNDKIVAEVTVNPKSAFAIKIDSNYVDLVIDTLRRMCEEIGSVQFQSQA